MFAGALEWRLVFLGDGNSTVLELFWKFNGGVAETVQET